MILTQTLEAFKVKIYDSIVDLMNDCDASSEMLAGAEMFSEILLDRLTGKR